MTASYENKHVVITGGIGGLGEAVVGAFLEAGAVVHIPNFFDSVPESFSPRGHERLHVTNSVDLTDERAVTEYYASVGTVWASINLAGGFDMSPLVDTSLEAFNKMFNRNAVTCFLSCREAARAMRGSGGGRIVNVGARPAVTPVPGMVGYTCSKAAVTAMTESLALELADDGILVNAVLPSIIDTPDNRSAMPDADHDAWPKPAQMATTILFLASADNQLTSGSLVPVYGRS